MTPLLEARRSRALLLVLVVVHLLAITHQVDAGGGHSLLERTILGLFEPLQAGVTHAVLGAQGGWRGYVDLRGVRERNRELEARLAQTEFELMQARAKAQEAAHLRSLLSLRESGPLSGMAALIVERSGLPWYRTLILDKGTDDGVQLQAPVLAPTGLVGRVIENSAHAAKVQVLIDQQSGVGVLIERTRLPALAKGLLGRGGQGTPLLRVEFVPARADVVVGDTLVTSGLDRLYPPGLRVGRVQHVGPGSGLFREIEAVPAVELASLESVLVLAALPAADLRAAEGLK